MKTINLLIALMFFTSCGGTSNVYRKESPWPFGSNPNKSQAVEYRKYHDKNTTFEGWDKIEKNAKKEEKWRRRQ